MTLRGTHTLLPDGVPSSVGAWIGTGVYGVGTPTPPPPPITTDPTFSEIVNANGWITTDVNGKIGGGPTCDSITSALTNFNFNTGGGPALAVDSEALVFFAVQLISSSRSPGNVLDISDTLGGLDWTHHDTGGTVFSTYAGEWVAFDVFVARAPIGGATGHVTVTYENPIGPYSTIICTALQAVDAGTIRCNTSGSVTENEETLDLTLPLTPLIHSGMCSMVGASLQILDGGLHNPTGYTMTCNNFNDVIANLNARGATLSPTDGVTLLEWTTNPSPTCGVLQGVAFEVNGVP